MGASQNNSDLPNDLVDLPKDLEDMPSVDPSLPEASDVPEESMLESAINSPAGYPLRAIGKGISAVGSGLEYISEKIDPYTGAPVRAMVGGIQEGKPTQEIAKQTFEQFLSGKVNPDTPTAGEVMYRAGKEVGMAPEYAEATGKYLGPFFGGAADLTNLIPGRAATKVVENVVPTAKAAVKGIDYLARGAGRAATKGYTRAGEIATAGALDSEKAYDAIRRLGPLELMLPGSKNYGPKAKAGKALGESREAAKSVPSPGGNRTVLDSAVDIGWQNNKYPGINVNPLTKHMYTILDSDKPITVGQVDDLLRGMEDPVFAASGDVKRAKKFINDITYKSRQELRKNLEGSKEGADILAGREKFSDLSSASKGAGVMRRSLTTTAAIGGSFLNPAAIALMATLPGTYYKIAGMAKIPYEVVSGPLKLLNKAYESKSVTGARDALKAIAEVHPPTAERILRAIALSPGRDETPEGRRVNQMLEKVQIPEGE